MTIKDEGGISRDALEFVALVHGVLHSIRQFTSEQLRPTGLAPGQFRFLQSIAKTPEPMRLVDIAHRLKIAQRSVTSKVQDAEQAGLVERIADEKDKRATRVRLTPRGQDILETVTQLRGDSAQEILSVLDEQERDQLMTLLHKIVDATA